MNKFHVEWIIFKKLMWLHQGVSAVTSWRRPHPISEPVRLHQGVSAVTSWRRPLKILHFVNDVTPWINFFEIIIKYIFLNLIDFDRSEALEFILRDYFLVQMDFDWFSINFMTMNKFHVEWIIFRKLMWLHQGVSAVTSWRRPHPISEPVRLHQWVSAVTS